MTRDLRKNPHTCETWSDCDSEAMTLTPLQKVWNGLTWDELPEAEKVILQEMADALAANCEEDLDFVEGYHG